MSRSTRRDIEKNSSRYAHTSNSEKVKVKTKNETTSMPYSLYNKAIILNSEEMRSQNLKLFTKSTHYTKSRSPLRVKEGYNLRQRSTADLEESQSPIAKKSNYSSLGQRDLDDSLTNYDGKTTNIKERSRNFQENPYPLSRRSRSAHTYIRDASPIYKQKRTDDTFSKSMESPDDYSLLSGQHTQKHHLLPAVSYDLGNHHKWDASLKASPSNKLQIQKMDLKQESVNLSKNWFLLLSKYFDEFLEILKNKLKENIQLYFDKKVATFRCVHVTLVKELLENDLTILNHNFNQQSWLNTKTQNWNILIASLQKLHFCAIFNEEDFSKTYVCSTVNDSVFILTKISEFLDECPRNIQITSHFREFMKHNKKFSHLKIEETAQGKIWIRNISQTLLLALKEEIRNANCQSYLLDENQYGLLFETKNNILSNIENKFQVKGQVCSASIPLVVEVNPQTNVSYMLKEESGNIPVDNLIILDHQKPSQDFTLELDRHHYKIWQNIPLDIPANQVVYAEICSEEFRLSSILEECLRKIYCSPFPVTVVGILPSLQIIKIWETFVDSLTLVVEYLRGEQVKIPHHYIMVSGNIEMFKKFEVEPSNETPIEKEDEKLVSLIPKVIEGDLTDQKVDAIVNSTNEEIDLTKGQISQALLKKAGPHITEEVKRQHSNRLECLQVFLTKGYGLPCSYVIHGVLPRPYKKSVVSTFVSNCLDKAVQCKFSSIAFPALGTGNLRYPPNEVAKEMKESIETFKKKHPNYGLKINIVLFPEQSDVQEYFSKEFGPENVPSNFSANREKKLKKMPQSKTLRWILFVNYSNKPRNLELALKSLQNEFKKVPFIIDSVNLEQLLFFTNIFELVPDIIAQYSEDKEKIKLLVSKENLKNLQDLLKDTQKKLLTDKLQIKEKLTNKQVEILTQKVQQLYPAIRCQFFDNDYCFSFQGFSEEEIKQAKDLLKSLLGFIDWNDPIHERESNLEGQETEKKHIYDVPVEENVKPSHCFLIANDFFIKVYADNILNLKVDGIVNIVDNARNESSQAIFAAAGEAVSREYAEKSKSGNRIIITSAGNLKKNKYIIHVLKPITSEDEHFSKKVENIVYDSLITAHNLNLVSVALSTKIFDLNGVLFDACAQGYLMGVMKFSENRQPNITLKEVHLVDLSPNICDSIINYFSQQLNAAASGIGTHYTR